MNPELKTIQDRLRRVSDLTIFGLAIKAGVNDDIENCIKMIAEQAADNRRLVSGIVSEETILLIENYLHEYNN